MAYIPVDFVFWLSVFSALTGQTLEGKALGAALGGLGAGITGQGAHAIATEAARDA